MCHAHKILFFIFSTKNPFSVLPLFMLLYKVFYRMSRCLKKELSFQFSLVLGFHFSLIIWSSWNSFMVRSHSNAWDFFHSTVSPSSTLPIVRWRHFLISQHSIFLEGKLLWPSNNGHWLVVQVKIDPGFWTQGPSMRRRSYFGIFHSSCDLGFWHEGGL